MTSATSQQLAVCIFADERPRSEQRRAKHRVPGGIPTACRIVERGRGGIAVARAHDRREAAARKCRHRRGFGIIPSPQCVRPSPAPLKSQLVAMTLTLPARLSRVSTPQKTKATAPAERHRRAMVFGSTSTAAPKRATRTSRGRQRRCEPSASPPASPSLRTSSAAATGCIATGILASSSRRSAGGRWRRA